MTKPHTEVHIDFDEDGVFDSDEEVTSDLRGFSIVRGKDVFKRRAASATLDMMLNNFEHKYTPANASSSLYPFQLPGPNVRIRMGYPADSFNDTSQTALNDRTPDLAGADHAGDWVAPNAFQIKLDSGAAYTVVGVTSTGDHLAFLDYGEENVKVAAKIARPQNISGSPLTYPYKQPLLLYRYEDSANYTYLYLKTASVSDPFYLAVGEVIAGSDSEIGSVQLEDNISGTTYWPYVELANDFATVETRITGTTLEVSITGAQSFAHQFTGLTRLDGTKHGIGGKGFTSGTDRSVASAGAGAMWSEFGMFTEFIGRVDTVDPQTKLEDRVTYIRAFDDCERMNAFNLFTGSPDTPATAGDIADRILTRANFSGAKLLDDGTTLTIAPTASNHDTRKVIDGNALDEMYQLQDDEVGFFFIDAAGTARFEAADHRENNDHTASVTYWRDTSDYAKHIMGPIDWDDGQGRVENQIFYKYFRASKTLGADVWHLQVGDDPQFDFTNRQHPSAGSFGVIDIVTVGDGDAIADPLIPVPVTDYTINEESDGTGQDWLTPLCSEVGTVSMVNGAGGVYTLDDTGQNFVGSTSIAGIPHGRRSGFIVIQDNSGNTAIAQTATTDPDGDGTKVSLLQTPEDTGVAGLLAVDDDFSESDTPLTYDCYLTVAYPLPGYEGNFQFLRFIANNVITLTTAPTVYVTSAQLKASKLVASEPAATRAEDSTSYTRYGQRRVNHDTKHIADWDTAQGRAEKRLALRKDSRELLKCHMMNSTEENLMEMLYREVSDRVRIRIDDMGVDRDHFIENYRMEYLNTGEVKMQWEVSRISIVSGLNWRYDDPVSKYGTATFA